MLARFPTIVVDSVFIAPGCEHFAFGKDVDGVHLTLQSVGSPFGAFDIAGTWVPSTPSPADIVVSVYVVGWVPIAAR